MVMSMTAMSWPRQVRALFLVAAALFVVTVTIGIVNGLDLVDFSQDAMRPTLLTHVHAGTVGWITLGIIASAIWFFRSGDARLTTLFLVAVPLYVAAFYSGNLPARAIFGVILLVAILWLFVWVWRQAMARRSLPALAIALGLTSFTYGAVIGVVLQVQLASGTQIFPKGGDVIGAHASTMVFAYLVLAAMGILEWRLKGTTGYPRLGLLQIGTIFAGGLVLALTLLLVDGTTDSGAQLIQAAGGIDLLLNLVSVVLFAVRIWPIALRTTWTSAAPARHWHAAAIFAPIAMALFMYIIYKFVSNPDLSNFPIGVLVALDHTVFIGVITNLAFGNVFTLAADRADRWPWAGQAIFWILNVGLVIFAVGLIAESAEIKRIGAPIMGIGALLGIATVYTRLWSSDLRVAEAT